MVAPDFFGYRGRSVVPVTVVAVVMTVTVTMIVMMIVGVLFVMTVTVVLPMAVVMVFHRRQLGQSNRRQDHRSRQVQGSGVVEQVRIIHPVQPTGEQRGTRR